MIVNNDNRNAWLREILCPPGLLDYQEFCPTWGTEFNNLPLGYSNAFLFLHHLWKLFMATFNYHFNNHIFYNFYIDYVYCLECSQELSNDSFIITPSSLLNAFWEFHWNVSDSRNASISMFFTALEIKLSKIAIKKLTQLRLKDSIWWSANSFWSSNLSLLNSYVPLPYHLAEII